MVRKLWGSSVVSETIQNLVQRLPVVAITVPINFISKTNWREKNAMFFLHTGGGNKTWLDL